MPRHDRGDPRAHRRQPVGVAAGRCGCGRTARTGRGRSCPALRCVRPELNRTSPCPRRDCGCRCTCCGRSCRWARPPRSTRTRTRPWRRSADSRTPDRTCPSGATRCRRTAAPSCPSSATGGVRAPAGGAVPFQPPSRSSRRHDWIAQCEPSGASHAMHQVGELGAGVLAAVVVHPLPVAVPERSRATRVVELEVHLLGALLGRDRVDGTPGQHVPAQSRTCRVGDAGDAVAVHDHARVVHPKRDHLDWPARCTAVAARADRTSKPKSDMRSGARMPNLATRNPDCDEIRVSISFGLRAD